jgi:HTH-type transcriptional regulator, glycine betaine synthesis regulator
MVWRSESQNLDTGRLQTRRNLHTPVHLDLAGLARSAEKSQQKTQSTVTITHKTPSVPSRARSIEHFSGRSFFLEITAGCPHFPAFMLQKAIAADEVANSRSRALTELEIEAIELFVNFLKLIGLPKSVGEIYGLLFVSPTPLTMEEIMGRLGISLGAASQGLKVLRGVGAARAVYSPGSRRDHFAADLELSRFATVFINEELGPRLERALERIEHLELLLPLMPAEDREMTRQRLKRLRHWLEKGNKILPWTLRYLMK